MKKFDEQHDKVMGRDNQVEILDKKYVGKKPMPNSPSLNQLNRIISSFMGSDRSGDLSPSIDDA